MICKCGNVPLMEPVIECGFTRWVIRCEKCGKKTQGWILESSAEIEWEKINKNFPTCDTCENYRDDFDPSLCTYHDRGTEDKWTCPDHLDKYTHDEAKDDTKQYTHEHNKNLLDTHFGASADELLQGLTIKKEIDYKAEFLKLEKDYFEDVTDLKADLKTAQDKVSYWRNEYYTSEAYSKDNIELLNKIKEVLK